MARKIIKNEEEAQKILRELMKTPQLVDLHFEFEIGTDKLPMVQYEVKRFAYGEKFE